MLNLQNLCKLPEVFSFGVYISVYRNMNAAISIKKFDLIDLKSNWILTPAGIQAGASLLMI